MRASLLLVAIASPCFAQCSGGSCSAGSSYGGFEMSYAPPYQYSQFPTGAGDERQTFAKKGVYSWWARKDNPNVVCLWRGDEFIGEIDPDAKSWRFAWESKPSDLMKLLGKSREAKPAAAVASKKCDEDCGCKFTNNHSKCVENCECLTKSAAAEKPARKITDEELRKLAGVKEESDIPDLCRKMDGCKVEPIDGSSPGERERYLGNFGVKLSEIGRGGKYTIDGRNATPAEALEAIKASGSVPDDATLPRLTIIGSESARKRVLDDLKTMPEFAYWNQRLVVNQYPADHWRITSGGFVTPANQAEPVIYVQDPGGRVLWRQDNYDGGGAALAKALRDRIPTYDPSKDPTPQTVTPIPSPLSPGGGDNGISPWWLAGIVGIFAAFIAWIKGSR